MHNSAQAFLELKRIAFFGVSRSEQKLGNSIYRAMKSHGYQLYPVHSDLEEIDGDVCFKTLKDIYPMVEGILINVTPVRALEILGQAAELRIFHVWMQQGAESTTAKQFAATNNISLTTGLCILLSM